MIPSANSTEQKAGDWTWPSAETWRDQGVFAAPCSWVEGRYLQSSRQPVWDWETATILAQQMANGIAVDQGRDYRSGFIMQAEAVGGVPSLRQYKGLLPAAVHPPTLCLSTNTWGLLSSLGVRDAPSSFQPPWNSYCHSLGASGVSGDLAGNGSSIYEDPKLNLSGFCNIDYSRSKDVVKRELCTTDDLNARLGLNLGGRTYSSAGDTAFERLRKRPRPISPGISAPLCHADGCNADLSIAKQYHRRHKVCELHSKAPTVLIGGRAQRFCQQCSRFHCPSEFDDGKRSCRERLADHNKRRRKQLQYPSTISCTKDQTTTQNDESAEAAASENNEKG